MTFDDEFGSDEDPRITTTALILAIFSTSEWTRRRELFRVGLPLLLYDASDGVLAVLGGSTPEDEHFRHRVDALRQLLAGARSAASGPAGADSTAPIPDVNLSHMAEEAFEAMLGDSSPMVEPCSIPECLLLARSMSNSAIAVFLSTASWHVRKRIYEAFPTLFSNRTLIEKIREIEGTSSVMCGGDNQSSESIADVLDRALTEGSLALDRPRRAVAYIAGLDSYSRQPILLDPIEQAQLLAAAYAEAPTVERRIDIIRNNSEMLQPEFDMIFDMTANRYPDGIVWRLMYQQAKLELAQARTSSPDILREIIRIPIILSASHVHEISECANSDNPLTAVAARRRILHLLDPAIAPSLYAGQCIRLAKALANFTYTEQLAGLAELYSEEAVARCYEAIDLLATVGSTAECNEANLTLAVALIDRVRGDKWANMDSARRILLALLSAHRADRNRRAEAQVAFLLSQLTVLGPSTETNRSLPEAAHYAQLAVNLSQRGDRFHTQTLINYALILKRRAFCGLLQDRLQLLDAAIEQLRLAANGPQDHNTEHSSTILLAECLSLRHRTAPKDRDADSVKAIRMLSEAIKASDRSSRPREWAELQESLAKVYFRYDRDSVVQQDLAVAAATNALTALPPIFPAIRRRVLVLLSQILFRAGNWSRCVATVNELEGLGEGSKYAAYTREGQYSEVLEGQQSHELKAYSLFRLDKTWEALEAFELGKFRIFLSSWPDTSEPNRSVSELLSLVPPRAAMVVPLITRHGAVVWIIRSTSGGASLDVLDIPDLDFNCIDRLLLGFNGADGWIEAYADYVRAQENAAADQDSASRASLRWASVLDRTCRDLWHLLIGNIYAQLEHLGFPKQSHVVFVVSGPLSLLPLHAAWRRREKGKREYFLDKFVVSYLPGLQSLSGRYISSPAPRPEESMLVSIMDNSLTNAEAETTVLASMRLIGNSA